MILPDTSVWVGHFRREDRELARLLDSGMIVCHPFVIGEVALGSMRQRITLLNDLLRLPRCSVATDNEVLEFIRTNALFDRGIGYVDVHLLAAVRLTAGSKLWTLDKRLHRVAVALGSAKVTG